ncbi:MAG: hypothetical protein HYZ28_18515 [Myxococcales bacterium]|nr:hypothetical protein [Myxococcales bacterium]
MRRWLPLLVPLVLAAAAARADWFQLSVPGLPYDVQVHDAGHLVVATSQVAQSIGVSDAGVVTLRGTLLPPDPTIFAGAFEAPNGCLAALEELDSWFVWQPGCGSKYAINLGRLGTGMRRTSRGGAYALTFDLAGSGDLAYERDGGSETNWVQAASVMSSDRPRALGVISLGNDDFAMFAAADINAHLSVARNEQFLHAFMRGSLAGDYPRDVLLYDNAGVPGALVVESDAGLSWVGDVSSASALFDPVVLQPPATVVGVGFTLEGGDTSAGLGHGLVTARDTGGTAFFGAVPDPSKPGRAWIQRAGPAFALPADAGRVACIASRFCAVLMDSDGGVPNVLAYWNNNPAVPSPTATYSLSPGQTLPVTVAVQDLDEDPVFVSWATPDGGSYSELAVVRTDVEGRAVDLTAVDAGFCGPTKFPFLVTASDGLAAHARTAATEVIVQRPTPANPLVNVADASVQPPSSPAFVTFVASPGAGGCAPASYDWQASPGWPAGTFFDGGSVTVPTPAVLCGPDSGVYAFGVRAVDDAGFSSGFTSISYEVLRHDLPDPPVATPSSLTLEPGGDAGVIVASAAGTGCAPQSLSWAEQTDSGFPNFRDGGFLIVYPLAQNCGPSPITADYVATASGLDGTASASPVQVTLNVRDIPDQPTVQPDAAVWQLGAGPVTFTASSVGGCPPLGYAWSELGDSGYPWFPNGGLLMVDAGPTCSSSSVVARYSVTATGDGGVSLPTEVTLTIPATDLQLAPNAGPNWSVDQDGGTVTSVASEAPGSCPALSWRWRHKSGPLFDWDAGPSASSNELQVRIPNQCDPLFGTATYGVVAIGSMVTSIETDVTVDVMEVKPNPLDQATLTVIANDRALPSRAEGSVNVQGLTCMDRRYFTIRVQLYGDAGLESEAIVDAGAPFTLYTRHACAGGNFDVVASIADSGTPVADAGVFLPGTPAGLVAVFGGSAFARCGEPLQATLQATFPEPHCNYQEVAWRIVDGGLRFLELSPGQVARGNELTLTSGELELHEMIGQEFQLEVVADAGWDSVSTSVGVRVSVEQDFIAVEHRTDPPIASEATVLGMTLLITNRTPQVFERSCDVKNLVLHEELDGLRYVPGTARLRGQPAEAKQDGDFLYVSIPSLEAGETAKLTYMARPPLLGKPKPHGRVLINGVPVSGKDRGIGAPDRRPVCGCTAGDGLTLAAGAALLALLRRRARG